MGAQSVLLRWAVRILSVHKEVQRRVQDEIEEVVGDERDVLWSDREKLPYLRATICEIQRFADILPAGIAHSTTEDVTFRGFRLPKGTMVLANLTSCHRDPAYWKSPLDFLPEQHLLKNFTLRPPHGDNNSLGTMYEVGTGFLR